MEQSLDKKDLKAKLILFLNKNKIKIFSIISLILIIFFLFFFYKESLKKKNILISEKYITAGILLAEGKKEMAKKFLEEVISSNNNFYGLLALNSILEKNLIIDKKKIIGIFQKLENQKLSDEQLDLILFKKALYLIKNDDANSGKKILNNLIKKNSNLKFAAEELIK